MHSRMNAILGSTNVIGTITWIHEAQNYFGAIGAVLGCISGFMIICINWERFVNSRFVKSFIKD